MAKAKPAPAPVPEPVEVVDPWEKLDKALATILPRSYEDQRAVFLDALREVISPTVPSNPEDDSNSGN